MIALSLAEIAEVVGGQKHDIPDPSVQVTGPGFSQLKTYPLQTRLGWGPETRTFTELQKPGEAFTPSAELMRGLMAGSVTLEVFRSDRGRVEAAGLEVDADDSLAYDIVMPAPSMEFRPNTCE